MYIKRVTIQGFRSYKDQTEVEPFSPRHNVIVGRNGSGKSNFFFAIQFVLSDEFSHMGTDERLQLLHEGTGSRVISAFVEITFDNEDGRIPIDKNEVTLRRTIGAKKDSYYLERKHVTKNDVVNLLEGAGFSRSNPYYIVKQGRINQIATAPETKHLQLLREVAGTRVYDERKDESLKILKETEAKQAKVEEMLTYIEERLSSLKKEKEELSAHQELDKMRRSLEYTIHDKELRDTRQKLEAIDSTRDGNTSGTKKLHDELEQLQTIIESKERQLREVKSQVNDRSAEKTSLQEEHQELVKQRAQLEFKIQDLKDTVRDDEGKHQQCTDDLAQIESKIRSKQAQLDELLPTYHNVRAEEERLGAQLKACEQKRSELYAKQGRVEQFHSKEERDRWIKKEIYSMNNSVAQKEEQIKMLRAECTELRDTVGYQESAIEEKTRDIDSKKQSLDQVNKRYTDLKIKRDDLINQRKELWRQDSIIDQSLQTNKDELAKYERNLRGTMGKAIGNGLDSIRRIVRDKHIPGVYGPLIDNFTCEQRMFTAVEVTAGNRLFNVIVDSDRTANEILKIMNKHKMPGEITFLPLEKLRPPNIRNPDDKDAIPLAQHLHYDSKFKKAIDLVFGGTLVCRDIEKAASYSRNYRVDCVTLEGDQVSRKGALTGGYYDNRRSRLEQQRMIRELGDKMAAIQDDKNRTKDKLKKLDGTITTTLREIQQAETKQIQYREGFEREKLELRNIQAEYHTNKRQLEPKDHRISVQQKDLESIKSSIASLKAELGTELLSQLSTEDQIEVQSLGNEIKSIEKKLKDCLSQRTEFENQKNKLENLLYNNLMRQREELKQDLDDISLTDTSHELTLLSAEYDQLCSTIQTNKDRLNDVERQLDDATMIIKELDNDLEGMKAREREQSDKITEESKSLEKLTNKRSLLLKKKDENLKKIRELGSLPSDAFTKYQHDTLSTLWKKLEKCNKDLKKYSHVNKKALDQYISFSDQKERLTQRKDELDRGYQSIKDLIDVLEQRKHEAICFTFKQVAQNFTEVFHELVPQGHGQLVMKRSTEDVLSPSLMSDESTPSSVVSSEGFTGISIRVSFVGVSAEMKELQQLSGGQKSLVALTLIFAIQKCDPAPFYLFDEIDQALDPTHRHAVADMIHRLSENAQFITTTFRSELLEQADKCYGVQFRNKVSSIKTVSKENARKFIITETADK